MLLTPRDGAILAFCIAIIPHYLWSIITFEPGLPWWFAVWKNSFSRLSSFSNGLSIPVAVISKGVFVKPLCTFVSQPF